MKNENDIAFAAAETAARAEHGAVCRPARDKFLAKYDATEAKYLAAIAPHRAKRDATRAAAYNKIWDADATYDLAKAPHIAAFTAARDAAIAEYDAALVERKKP